MSHIFWRTDLTSFQSLAVFSSSLFIISKFCIKFKARCHKQTAWPDNERCGHETLPTHAWLLMQQGTKMSSMECQVCLMSC